MSKRSKVRMGQSKITGAIIRKIRTYAYANIANNISQYHYITQEHALLHATPEERQKGIAYLYRVGVRWISDDDLKMWEYAFDVQGNPIKLQDKSRSPHTVQILELNN